MPETPGLSIRNRPPEASEGDGGRQGSEAVLSGRKRRALVTGGAGFVGSHLCEALLQQDWEVFALDDLSTGEASNLGGCEGVVLMRADVSSSVLVKVAVRLQPQVVFHLAALSSVPDCGKYPVKCARVNIVGARKVVDAAVASRAEKLVNISSLAAVSHPRGPGGFYGQSKLIAEAGVVKGALRSGLRFTTLRPANIYGPRQRGGGEAGVVASWLGAIKSGHPVYLDGHGGQTRDFLYVGDAVSAMVAAAHSGDGMTLEVGTGVETSLKSLLSAVADVTGWSDEPEARSPRPGDALRSVVDPEPARKALGWSSATALEEGLGNTWEWWRAAG